MRWSFWIVTPVYIFHLQALPDNMITWKNKLFSTELCLYLKWRILSVEIFLLVWYSGCALGHVVDVLTATSGVVLSWWVDLQLRARMLELVWIANTRKRVRQNPCKNVDGNGICNTNDGAVLPRFATISYPILVLGPGIETGRRDPTRRT